MSNVIRTMRRTQIYLPNDLYHELRLATQKTSLSMSEVVRQAIHEKLTDTHKGGIETLARIAKIGGRGPKDLAKNLEKYLYGKK